MINVILLLSILPFIFKTVISDITCYGPGPTPFRPPDPVECFATIEAISDLPNQERIRRLVRRRLCPASTDAARVPLMLEKPNCRITIFIAPEDRSEDAESYANVVTVANKLVDKCMLAGI